MCRQVVAQRPRVPIGKTPDEKTLAESRSKEELFIASSSPMDLLSMLQASRQNCWQHPFNLSYIGRRWHATNALCMKLFNPGLLVLRCLSFIQTQVDKLGPDASAVLPPILVIHCGGDSVVPVVSSQRFMANVAKLRSSPSSKGTRPRTADCFLDVRAQLDECG